MSYAAGIIYFGYTIMAAIFALVSAFFLPAEFAVIPLCFMYSSLTYAVSFMIGEQRGDDRYGLKFLMAILGVTLIVFAILYWRYGLIVDGNREEVSFLTSLYFSVTTFTTLGYGDFTPTPRLRIIASCEAIFGYIGLGIYAAILVNRMQTIVQRTVRIRDHNANLGREHKEQNMRESEQVDSEGPPTVGPRS